jgi:hypothetical protein
LALLASCAAAKPSVTGIGTSENNDIEELKDFLSGTPNQSSAALSADLLAKSANATNSANSTNSSGTAVQFAITPNAGFFENNSVFGEFFKDFFSAGGEENSSWVESYVSYSVPSPKAGRHNFKPVLIDGPNF